MPRMVAELIGNDRLEYSYQPQVPPLGVLLHLNRCALPGRHLSGCWSMTRSGCRPRRGAGMEAAGLQELRPVLVAIGIANENSSHGQPGK